MQTKSAEGRLYPVVEQVTQNTTSWIGRPPGDNKELTGGQTFIAPNSGELGSIEIFSSLVIRSGQVSMSLHEFDPVQKTWGPVMASATVSFIPADSGKWISFPLNGVYLQQGKSYGFLLQAQSSFIGVGEATDTHRHPPFHNGQEWKFSSEDRKGEAFTYFSLAFKVALRA